MMNILVIAGLSDYKLKNTLEPISGLEVIDNIFLVRKKPLVCDKVISYCPPEILRKSIILTELYRFFSILYLLGFKKVDKLIGMYLYPHCIFTAFFGKIFRKDYIISMVENPGMHKNLKIMSFVVKDAKAVAVRGSKGKKYIEDSFNVEPPKVIVLPDYYDPTLAERSIPSEKIYDFLFLSDFSKEKRIDFLMDVFEDLTIKGYKFNAVIAGSGPLKNKMDKYFQAKDFKGNVKMIGFVDDIYNEFRKAKTFIMTSETEGMPSVLIEAMSCGLPFIVPDVGDITDYAINGVNAIVYKALDIDECSEACIKIISEPGLSARLSTGAEEIWQQKKDDLTIDNVRDVWNKMLF